MMMDETERAYTTTAKTAYAPKITQDRVVGRQAAREQIDRNFGAAQAIPGNKPDHQLTADQCYQKSFAQQNRDYANPNKRDALASSRDRLQNTDLKAGKEMAKGSRHSEAEIAQTLDKNSPEAARIGKSHGAEEKSAYCHQMAKRSTEQSPNERPERSLQSTNPTHSTDQIAAHQSYHSHSR
jgi:hypothetical protein